MTVPEPVQDLCGRFLSLAPEGLVTGLYLTGGLGFGEWIEGQPDVDFVATLAHRPSADNLDTYWRTTHAVTVSAASVLPGQPMGRSR